MNGLKSSPGIPSNTFSNPFDSDDESDKKPVVRSSRKPSSEIVSRPPNASLTNPFDDVVDDRERGTMSSVSKYTYSHVQMNKYKNDFRDSGGIDNQSVEELENYAVYRSKETTNAVNNCLKIAEGIREDATNTMVALHQQGEQITRIHQEAVNIDYELSLGEKLLGTLGGLFSRTWKPKNAPVKGPAIVRGDPVWSKGNHLEQREKLGLKPASNDHSRSRTPPPETANALQKIEVEKVKQDDALSDLSDLLGELKVMAVDMGSEIENGNKALSRLDEDVHALNDRVKSANQRGRRLIGK